MSGPPVSVVIATYGGVDRLPWVLNSLARQRYEGEVDLICVDGGAGDGTRELAESYGAVVIDNPHRIQELGQSIGIEAVTKGELVLLIDDDDEIPHDDWLARMVAALDLAPDVAVADSLYHEWRRKDPAIVRLMAMIGSADPLAVEFGWADRWAVHLGRWTGMPVLDEEDVGDALLVRIDPELPPPMMSNGVLVRRGALLAAGYRPFVHPDVAADLAAQGWRFARVKQGIVHHFATSFPAALGKIGRRARVTTDNKRQPRRGFPPPPLGRRVLLVLDSLLLVGPSLRALRGYRRRPDPAWALYPLLHLATTVAYIVATARTALGKSRVP